MKEFTILEYALYHQQPQPRCPFRIVRFLYHSSEPWACRIPFYYDVDKAMYLMLEPKPPFEAFFVLVLPARKDAEF